MRSRAPSTASTNPYRRASYRGARVLVHCVKDACYLDALFAMLRYHPFLTNSVLALPRPTSPTAVIPSSKPPSATVSMGTQFSCQLGRSSMQDRR
jgi:hypothetical protein